MANQILTKGPAVQPMTQYRLPEEARQKILAQSSSAQLHLEIERQRAAFVRLNGNAFGVDACNAQ